MRRKKSGRIAPEPCAELSKQPLAARALIVQEAAARVFSAFMNKATLCCTIILRAESTEPFVPPDIPCSTFTWDDPVNGHVGAMSYVGKLCFSRDPLERKKGRRYYDTFCRVSSGVITLYFASLRADGMPRSLSLRAEHKHRAALLLLDIASLGLEYWTCPEASGPALHAMQAAREMYQEGHLCDLTAPGTLSGARRALSTWYAAQKKQGARQDAAAAKAARARKQSQAAGSGSSSLFNLFTACFHAPRVLGV